MIKKIDTTYFNQLIFTYKTHIDDYRHIKKEKIHYGVFEFTLKNS